MEAKEVIKKIILFLEFSKYFDRKEDPITTQIKSDSKAKCVVIQVKGITTVFTGTIPLTTRFI